MGKFKCNCCGECCSNYLPLSKVEFKDLKKLAKKMGKSFKSIGINYYDKCPFLDNSNKCSIYEKNRPLICKEYSCYNFKHKLFENVKDMISVKRELVNLREQLFNEKRI